MPTSVGMVAEKSIDCRLAGSARHDRADVADEAEIEHLVALVEHEMADLVEQQFLRVHQILMRPGVPTTMSVPRLHPLHLRRAADAAEDDDGAEAGAVREVADAFLDLQREFARRRQDQRSACRRDADARFSASRCWMMGRAKAPVLPVPVWATPSRSRPARSSGMARAWIGVGAVKDSAASARWMGSISPRERRCSFVVEGFQSK